MTFLVLKSVQLWFGGWKGCLCKMEVIVPQQAGEATQLLCSVHTVGKGLEEIQDYQVPLSD